MKNFDIAKIFYEIADMLDIKGVQWEPRAYRKGAQTLENLSKDIEEVYEKGGIKELKKIQSIGDALAKKIESYIKTGKIQKYEDLKKSFPEHFNELIQIQGMGPKKALLLREKLGIKTVKDLEKAIKQHKLANLKNLGEKTEKNIAQGIELYKKGQERRLLGFALPIAKEIKEKLENLKEIKKVVIAGSLRRRKETIKDIDILVISSKPKKVMNFFTSINSVKRIIAKGDTKSSVLLDNNMQVDLRVISESQFGSALQYFSGSKEHGVKLRQIAIKKCMKLSEYGLFDRNTNKLLVSKTEKEIYNKIGLQYPEPELRENQGEIEAALKNKLPKLIELSDIKGDMHIHSNYSDGNNTIKDIAKAAIKKGYQYICLSDHSQSLKIAHGLTISDLKKQWKEIDKLNYKNFKILKGSEVDILSNNLDYNDSILKKFDFVTASIHTGFKQSKEKITSRILSAIENEHVNCIGHLTGRLINKRAPYEIDTSKIFKAAADTNTFMEVNAHPVRLDLKDTHVREAISKGVKIIINTDAHIIDELDYMKYGVYTARRGWATKKDIVNTLSLKEINKVIK
jgi:DNA polymerase (family X)